MKTPSIEEMLYECCKRRGNPIRLIHRTLKEFSWFIDKLIFDREAFFSDKDFPVKDAVLIMKIKEFPIGKEENILYEEAQLFLDYCKHIYDPNYL